MACTNCEETNQNCNECSENLSSITKIIDDCICKIVNTSVDAYSDALKKGVITPSQFESFYENINKYAHIQYNSASGEYTFGIVSAPVLFVTLTTANVPCNGASTGTAAASVSGGVAPYTLAWTDMLDVVVNPAALAAGAYKLTVTDNSGNTKVVTFSITEPTAITALTSVTNESAPAAADGTATVTPSGGTSPYTYLWSDAQTTQTATGLVAGTYSVTITDDNGCTLLVEDIVVA